MVKEGVTVADRRWHLVFETLEKPDKSFVTKLPDTKLVIRLVTGAHIDILKLCYVTSEINGNGTTRTVSWKNSKLSEELPASMSAARSFATR